MIKLNINQLFRKKGEYGMTLFLPEAKTDGILPRFLTNYAFKSAGIPIGADIALELLDTINKKLYGGLGVNGTLSFSDGNVQFKPILFSFLVAKNVELICIPIKDIITVKKEALLYVAQSIILDTANRSFKMMVTGDLNMKYFDSATTELYEKLSEAILNNHP